MSARAIPAISPATIPPVLPLRNAITETRKSYLVGYWPLLSRGALIRDYSGQGNHLTNSSGVTFEGQHTFCFNGSSYLTQAVLLTGSGTGGQLNVTDGSASIDNLANNWDAYRGHFVHFIDTANKHCVGYIGYSSGNSNSVSVFSSPALAQQSWLIIDSGFNNVSLSSYTIQNRTLQMTGDTTIGLWFKRGLDDFPEDKCLINRFSVMEYALFIAGATEKLTFLVYSPAGTSMSVTTQNAYTSTTDWYFVTATYNSTTMLIKIYINGELAANPVNTGFSSLRNSYSLLHIGNLLNSNHYIGKIAHPFKYNCELCQREIQRIYDEVKPS